MIRKVLKNWSPVIMLAAWLVLIWSRIVMGITKGFGTTVLEILIECVLVMIWGSVLYKWDDETDKALPIFEKEESESDLLMQLFEMENDCDEPAYSPGLQNSLCAVLGLTVLCMLSFVLSVWTGWLDLFGSSIYIRIGWFGINKKDIYHILVVMIFPLWTTFIIRKVRDSGFIADAVLSGVMQILALTLTGILLYMRRSGIWLTEMAVLNVITLILAVRGYVWRTIERKGKAAALLILYILFWTALLFAFSRARQFTAGLMGFTDTTQGAGHVLLDGGGFPPILLILAEVIFLAALAGVLVQSRTQDGREIMQDMIWIGFFIRVAAGLLYLFGVPIPAMLPFTGTGGMFADSFCMGMLLLGFVNKRRNEWCEFPEEDFPAGWENDEDGEDEEDDQQTSK